MKVGILGSGDVAKALAEGFLKHGHEVTVGSRTPDKLAQWAAATSGAKTGTFADAAGFGELIVLAVKGTAALEVLGLAGKAKLRGKPIFDTTNPIADAPPEKGVLPFFTEINLSLMEQLQAEIPEAKFVKIFSSVGAALMVNPSLPGGKPTMFLCGNDEGAKKIALEILDAFGWEAADMGGAEAARAIEPLSMLWCIPGFLSNQWMHAFKLLKA